MDKELIASTLKKLKENSPKKNFKQSVDLIINLKGLDLKREDHMVNIFASLSHDTGKKVSVCALVDADMESKAKEACDEVILLDHFARFKSKADIKKLANRHNFFIAQASIMPKIAAAFGRYLGPRGKMPNPKIGGVLPPNANIKSLCEKLKKTVSLVTKNEPAIKCKVGQEDTPDDAIIDNIMAIYNSIIPKLPNEEQNIRNAMIKLTMGPAFAIEKDEEEKQEKRKGRKSALKIKSEKEEGQKPEEKSEIQKEKPWEAKEEIKKQETKPELKKKAPKPKQSNKTASEENKK